MTYMQTPGPVGTRRIDKTFGGVEQKYNTGSKEEQPKPNPYLCEDHKRATRMFGYSLPLLNEPHSRHALAVVWSVRLTRLERGGVALAALNACDPEDALAIIKAAYRALCGKGEA
ncbi:hypothetical protein ACW9UR_13795 [Halovulum sp. GXIMD14794]